MATFNGNSSDSTFILNSATLILSHSVSRRDRIISFSICLISPEFVRFITNSFDTVSLSPSLLRIFVVSFVLWNFFDSTSGNISRATLTDQEFLKRCHASFFGLHFHHFFFRSYMVSLFGLSSNTICTLSNHRLSITFPQSKLYSTFTASSVHCIASIFCIFASLSSLSFILLFRFVRETVDILHPYIGVDASFASFSPIHSLINASYIFSCVLYFFIIVFTFLVRSLYSLSV